MRGDEIRRGGVETRGFERSVQHHDQHVSVQSVEDRVDLARYL